MNIDKFNRNRYIKYKVDLLHKITGDKLDYGKWNGKLLKTKIPPK